MNKPAFRRAVAAVDAEFQSYRDSIDDMKRLGVGLDYRGEYTLHTKRLEAIEAIVRQYLEANDSAANVAV